LNLNCIQNHENADTSCSKIRKIRVLCVQQIESFLKQRLPAKVAPKANQLQQKLHQKPINCSKSCTKSQSIAANRCEVAFREGGMDLSPGR
jgi:hypothetical protein